MGNFAKKVGSFVVGSVISWCILKGVENKLDGKDVFGRKLKPKETTKVDWKGNIILGKRDFQII